MTPKLRATDWPRRPAGPVVSVFRRLTGYIYRLQPGKIVLWCYLIWYLVIVAFHFQPDPRLWLNSLGISAVIGTGLVLSVHYGQTNIRDHWQTFRLYLMPFCVSSFSALIQGQGFMVVIPPDPQQALTAIGSCLSFVLLVALIKLSGHRLS